MRRATTYVLAFAAGASGLSAQAVTPRTTSASTTITAADVRARVELIAHDSMGGRDTPSPGLTKTANWVAAEFARFGLEAAGEDGFLQWYPITAVRPGALMAHEFTLSGPSGAMSFGPGDGFVAFQLDGQRSAEGELAVISSLDELATLGDRIGVLRTTFQTMQSTVAQIPASLAEHQPEGLIIAMDLPLQMFAMARQWFMAEGVSLGREAGQAGPPVIITHVEHLPDALGSTLRAGEPLGDTWTATLKSDAEARALDAMNTVGILKGSDPTLQEEYVVILAHMDHIGVGQAVAGDSVYNGADDNASGTAMVVELAEAFSSLEGAPRRSLIFLTVSGEEKNLLGADWFSQHPVVPIENIVAAINMDMIGRNWEDSVVAIGLDESTLGGTLREVQAAHPEFNMGVMPDRWPELSLYTRSDSYKFAQQGVPIMYFMSRGHEDYHQPSDHTEKLKYDKVARMGRLIFEFGLAVANDDERPHWKRDRETN